MRKAFVSALTELADTDPRVLLLTGDLGFMAVEPFAERHPGRFINVGVAEQNMVGMATGLAEAGYVPFVYSIATFAALRSYEFIRNGPVLHDLPVRIVGVGPGLDYGPNGITHWALEDVAVLRPLPGLAVIAPADDAQTASAVAATAELAGPAYLRLARMGPAVAGLGGRFGFGRAHVVGDGTDLALVALGNMASTAVETQSLLAAQGVSARVVIVSCVRPAPIARSRRGACGRPAHALGRVALRRRRRRLADGGGRRGERSRDAPRARGGAPLAGRRDGQRRVSRTSGTASRPARWRTRRSSTSNAARCRCGVLHETRRSHPLAAGPDPRARGQRLRGRQSRAHAARAPRRRRRDHEPHARLAARGPAGPQRPRVRRARGAQRRPDARRGAAAHRLQLHRLRRVLVRDRRRADPAHQPDEHARPARAPREAQHRRLHPRRQLVGVRRERGRARGARLPRRQQRVRGLQGGLCAPHPLLRQAARPALARTCASTPSTARWRIPRG